MTAKKYLPSAPHIQPRKCTTPVPHRWQKLPVAKQGASDYACGLFALMTAAWTLATSDAESPFELLKMASSGKAWQERIALQMLCEGLYEPDLRLLAEPMGLQLDDARIQTVGGLRARDGVTLVFALVGFELKADFYVGEHFVMVLEYLAHEDAFVISDSHPWNPDVYCVPASELEAAWLEPQFRNSPLALAVRRAG